MHPASFITDSARLGDNSAMKTIARGIAGARESTTNKLAHDSVPFTSTCPKCQQPVLQHGYSRIVLFAFLDMLHPIDAHCPACDELWSISAEERDTISASLAARAA
jgi:hypothetical protein